MALACAVGVVVLMTVACAADPKVKACAELYDQTKDLFGHIGEQFQSDPGARWRFMGALLLAGQIIGQHDVPELDVPELVDDEQQWLGVSKGAYVEECAAKNSLPDIREVLGVLDLLQAAIEAVENE